MFAFSTLACPEWEPREIIRRAVDYGYDAIEWRGGADGHVNPDMPSAARTELRHRMEDAGLATLAVTSYTDYVSADPRVRRDSIDLLDGHLALAADLGASAVRVFLGVVDDNAPRDEHIARAVDGLRASVDIARGLGVSIAIEPHDDFARAASIAPVLAQLDPPVVGVVWDIVNAWGAGEQPLDGLASIRGRIRYVQVKDARWDAGTWRLTPIGDGAVPLAEALRALAADGPLPPSSVEWERAWHPALDPPEVALPKALRALRELVDHSRASLDSATSTPDSSSRAAMTSSADTRAGRRNSSSTS